jgi:hypothetical protein
MSITITVEEKIYINSSPEIVWDFTQDYSKRSSWDKSIVSSVVISTEPFLLVAITLKGNVKMKFRYKLFDRPNKTTLTIVEAESSWIEGGGGSWKYDSFNQGTVWTQVNTLVLKNRNWIKVIIPFLRYQLRKNSQKAMMNAKRLIERNINSGIGK